MVNLCICSCHLILFWQLNQLPQVISAVLSVQLRLEMLPWGLQQGRRVEAQIHPQLFWLLWKPTGGRDEGAECVCVRAWGVTVLYPAREPREAVVLCFCSSTRQTVCFISAAHREKHAKTLRRDNSNAHNKAMLPVFVCLRVIELDLTLIVCPYW